MPQCRIDVAGDSEYLHRFAEQVEHHQDQDEREEDGEAAREEQLHHVQSEPSRREEAEVDHASAAVSLGFGSIFRARLAAFAKNRSSAPIGCPPGWCASTWYIHRIIPANSNSGTHSARIGFTWP